MFNIMNKKIDPVKNCIINGSSSCRVCDEKYMEKLFPSIHHRRNNNTESLKSVLLSSMEEGINYKGNTNKTVLCAMCNYKLQSIKNDHYRCCLGFRPVLKPPSHSWFLTCDILFLTFILYLIIILF
uniref:Uncharacterized protein n=1 Tax=Clastoptera arizonana TaxID=38151 RepID=A0A1B6DJ84_9HEMI